VIKLAGVCMVAVLAAGACSGNTDPRFSVSDVSPNEPTLGLGATNLQPGGRYVVEEISESDTEIRLTIHWTKPILDDDTSMAVQVLGLSTPVGDRSVYVNDRLIND